MTYDQALFTSPHLSLKRNHLYMDLSSFLVLENLKYSIRSIWNDIFLTPDFSNNYSSFRFST